MIFLNTFDLAHEKSNEVNLYLDNSLWMLKIMLAQSSLVEEGNSIHERPPWQKMSHKCQHL